MADSPDDVLKLAEETLSVGKRSVRKASVRVRTVTDTTQELANVVLEHDDVEISRVPMGNTIEQAPPVRTEGDVTIVPVVEEVLVVEKRLILKEELHIRRRTTTETVNVPVTLRKQRAIVERQDYQNPTTQDPTTQDPTMQDTSPNGEENSK
ncbi:MAG TPA: YsnF/AvaK domain-containing protein [Arsenicitalea sp.]|jgi:uncharacterized protein (TIGR02271 family)|nr:YsnF/AvaK domain-containing protein [Arsenicitalea sp.]